MELSRVIVGPVFTEKAERNKLSRTYALKVSPDATKVEVKHALKKLYDVDAVSVRMLWIRPKVRLVGAGTEMTKRRAWKKAMVTLAPKSQALDLTKLKTA